LLETQEALSAAPFGRPVREEARRQSMTKLVLQFLLFLSVASVCAGPAGAIIPGVESDDEFSDTNSPYYGFTWDHVYRTGGASAVAIGYFRLLTAQHFWISTGDMFLVNGDEFEVVSKRLPPNDDDGQDIPPDMQVLELRNNTDPARPLPGFYPLYTGSFPPWQRDLILVGYGKTGTADSTSYREDAGSPRMLRWGTNEYKELVRRQADGSDPDRVDDWSTQCFLMGFRRADTDHEAGYGEGDSGGGAFIEIDGVWLLAGMNLYRGVAPRFDKLYAASIPYYADWITERLEEDRLPGDTNFDGRVDVADYLALKRGAHTSDPVAWESGDFNGNGSVDYYDAHALTTNFGYVSIPHPDAGTSAPTGTGDGGLQAMPEPTALCLLALGAVGLLRRRPRRGRART
jgi:hypothetical protein